MFKRLLLSALIAICGMSFAFAQVQVAGIAFYNLENLFDTIPNNPLGRDLEYTPNGKNQWDSRKYNNKIEKLSYAISQLTTKTTPNGPAIIGVSEIENRSVLEDLVAAPLSSLGTFRSATTIRPISAVSTWACSTIPATLNSKTLPITALRQCPSPPATRCVL